MIFTKNFHPDSDIKLLCTCGHPDCDERSVSQEHLNRIQNTRIILNHSMAVTSGGRCPNHPNEINKLHPADHQKGMGIDISCHGVTRGNIMIAGYKAGCNAFGIAKTFVHLGYRAETKKGHTTMWTYS